MIDANSFVREWCVGGDTVVRFPDCEVTTLALPDEHRLFLTRAGLPREAAPFLAFGAVKKRFLLPVTEVWPLASRRLGSYRVIGSTGNGDSICVVEDAGAVVVLDHDREFRETFVNTSVIHLAESLLLFRAFVDGARRSCGNEAFLENRIPTALREQTYGRMLLADERIEDRSSFWHNQLVT